jgi:hypothetical protein
MKEITNNFSGGILQTRDINLASALASESEVEFLPKEQEPVQRFYENGKEFYVFRFKNSPAAKRIYQAWNDPNFIENNPNDPVAMAKAYMHNKNRLLDVIKQIPRRNIIKKGNRIYLLSDETLQKGLKS